MKILYRNVLLVAGIWFVLFPAISYAQSAEAPVYKDGDWWRIKQEITRVDSMFPVRVRKHTQSMSLE